MRAASLTLGFLLAAFGCSGTTALEAAGLTDPDASSALLEASVGCPSCFEQTCSWNVQECSGDPGCARWLAHAQSCPASGTSPDLSCISAGPEPESQTGRQLRDSLYNCLQFSGPCCEGASGWGPGDGSFDAAASTETDAEATPDAPFCSGCTCDQCMAKLLTAQTGDECPQVVAACSTPGSACAVFAEKYEACMELDQTSDAGTASPAAECINKLFNDSQGSTNGQLQFMAGQFGCSLMYCADACYSDAESACLRCQMEQCPDAIEAFLLNASAQDLLYCIQACEGLDNAQQCRNRCIDAQPDGADILRELISCTNQSCAELCQ